MEWPEAHRNPVGMNPGTSQMQTDRLRYRVQIPGSCRAPIGYSGTFVHTTPEDAHQQRFAGSPSHRRSYALSADEVDEQRGDRQEVRTDQLSVSTADILRVP
ncbi:hypothetical protein Y032_0092g2528 [Ancylostoma ceylanicum]|uniref:Uncharacterized protein n=1 Tax=Ancylostoma ceylanicum TaxID=53326 RepID=A0A016TLR0_9BILA|nr:hypothetical protein Y032_0092g2528 [Ancylostoma ceylanicum]